MSVRDFCEPIQWIISFSAVISADGDYSVGAQLVSAVAGKKKKKKKSQRGLGDRGTRMLPCRRELVSCPQAGLVSAPAQAARLSAGSVRAIWAIQGRFLRTCPQPDSADSSVGKRLTCVGLLPTRSTCRVPAAARASCHPIPVIVREFLFKELYTKQRSSCR